MQIVDSNRRGFSVNVFRGLVILVAVIVLFVVFQALSVHGVKLNVADYKGDGKVKPVGSGFFSKGFEIVFDKFDLAKPYQNSYKISQLPKISRTKVLYFRIYENLRKFYDEKIPKTIFGGNIEVAIKSNNDELLVSSKTALVEWVKTSVTDWQTTDLYNISLDTETVFGTKSLQSKPINILIKYRPGKNFPTDKKYYGAIVLRAGGSK